VEVRVQSQNIEKALRDLKKKLQLDGLFGELKKRRHYEKPSVKKKNKELEAQKRKRKLLKRSRPSGSGSGTGPRRPSQSPASSSSHA
jgi:small subunit ribosomal protein S21